MKYQHFRQLTEKYPYFRSNLFPNWTNNPNLLRRQLSDWIKERKIVVLKRGLYTLNKNDRRLDLSKQAVAFALYTPSYLSLESALSYYQLIPERVELVTSITPKKTHTFSNELGNFKYFHLKQKAFNGFIQQKDEFGNPFFIATPEKALVDFFYFKCRALQTIHEDVFSASFRLQNCQQLSNEKLMAFSYCFQQKKLGHLVNLFIKVRSDL